MFGVFSLNNKAILGFLSAPTLFPFAPHRGYEMTNLSLLSSPVLSLVPVGANLFISVVTTRKEKKKKSMGKKKNKKRGVGRDERTKGKGKEKEEKWEQGEEEWERKEKT